MTESTITNENVKRFKDVDVLHRHYLGERIFYSEGVRLMAEKAHASWLVDEIALAQVDSPIGCESFQVWTLKVSLNGRATLRCNAKSGRRLYLRRIKRTYFPLDQIQICVDSGIMMLMSEL